jgi:hypothetical protein
MKKVKYYKNLYIYNIILKKVKLNIRKYNTYLTFKRQIR